MMKKGSVLGWILWLAILAGVVIVHVILKRHADYFTMEIASQIKKAENYVDILFIVLYGLVAMYPLSVITKFLKAEGIENARHNLGKMKAAVPPPPKIKSLNAGHKLRQAENDFVTVKNLYDNGLITEEMFLKRKAELKAILSSNEIFSKDDEASPRK